MFSLWYPFGYLDPTEVCMRSQKNSPKLTNANTNDKASALLSGQKHKKRLKNALLAGEEVHPSLMAQFAAEDLQKKQFTCELCDLTVPTEESMKFHLEGKYTRKPFLLFGRLSQDKSRAERRIGLSFKHNSLRKTGGWPEVSVSVWFLPNKLRLKVHLTSLANWNPIVWHDLWCYDSIVQARSIGKEGSELQLL